MTQNNIMYDYKLLSKYLPHNEKDDFIVEHKFAVSFISKIH